MQIDRQWTEGTSVLINITHCIFFILYRGVIFFNHGCFFPFFSPQNSLHKMQKLLNLHYELYAREGHSRKKDSQMVSGENLFFSRIPN